MSFTSLFLTNGYGFSNIIQHKCIDKSAHTIILLIQKCMIIIGADKLNIK